ncbi:MAG: DNA repair protein RecO [Colwellia sp.]
MAEEQTAFVLHTRPHKENQLMVTLLTELSGKVNALIFVGQSKKSTKKGLLQPFIPLSVSFKGQNSLKFITRVEAIAPSYALKKEHLFSGFYLNELLVKLLSNDIDCRALFLAYQNSLEKLNNEADLSLVLRDFELLLIDELGMSFDFSPLHEMYTIYSDEMGESIKEKAKGFYYVPEEGFVAAFSQQNNHCYDREHLELIEQFIRSKQSKELGKAKLTFKLLMRQVLNQLLGNQPLNSRALFKRKKFASK